MMPPRMLSARHPIVPTLAGLTWLVICSLMGPFISQAQEASQIHAAALRALQDGYVQRAEREFENVRNRFPGTPEALSAVRLQAGCLYKLGRYQSLAQLAQQSLTEDPDTNAELQYWVGMGQLARQAHAEAATAFERVRELAPDSALAREALLGQATAWLRDDRANEVLALFLPVSSAPWPADIRLKERPWLGRVWLLYCEALLADGKHDELSDALQRILGQDLPAEQAWRRDHVVIQEAFRQKDLEKAAAALQSMQESLAHALGSPYLEETSLWQGRLLEAQGRTLEARKLYVEAMPLAGSEDYRRFFQLRLAGLCLTDFVTPVEDKEWQVLTNAVTSVEDKPILQLAIIEKRVELLKAQRRAGEPQDAVSYDTLLQDLEEWLKDYSSHPNRGRAYLCRAWCRWRNGDDPGAREDWRAALESLQDPVQKTEASMMLGRSWKEAGDLEKSLQSFESALGTRDEAVPLTGTLRPRALYEAFTIRLDRGDLAGARKLGEWMLQDLPGEAIAQRLALEWGREEADAGNLEGAMPLFAMVKARGASPQYQHAAILEQARALAAEGQFDEALEVLGPVPEPVPETAWEIELERAALLQRKGEEDQALVIHEAFLKQQPEHAMVPKVLNWIADYHLRRSDFATAEAYYQRIFLGTQWASSPLKYGARLQAGRTALLGQRYSEARAYCEVLFNDENCPRDVAAQAYFTVGDSFLLERTTVNTLRRFENAITAYEKVPLLMPESHLVPRAFGQIANCHLQLASEDPNRYVKAIESYQKVVESEGGFEIRAAAKVGLAKVLERLAENAKADESERLKDTAMGHYQDVYYGSILREGEAADPFWVYQSMSQASRLLELRGRKPEAARLIQRMMDQFPSFKDSLQGRLDSHRAGNATVAP